MKTVIKKIWKALPLQWHEKCLSLLCRVKLVKRSIKTFKLEDDHIIYVVGSFQAGGGLSRSAHLYVDALREKGLQVICVDSTHVALQTVKNPIKDDSIISIGEVKKDLRPATVILHHNPPQLQIALCFLGQKFLEKKHIVAYWAWELEDIPNLWKDALHYVDAIEVPSSFTQKAIAKNTAKAVNVVPHTLCVPKKTKSQFGESGKLACLFIMDMGSLRLRKNPEAIIDAFTQAFSPEEAYLTIKLGQTQLFKADYEIIVAAAKDHKHVHIITHWVDDKALEELYLSHDVYISLHRSEGYGLTIREAMLYNLYIVATGWSGNMDFMQGEKNFAVPYTMAPIGKTNTALDCVDNAHWAEADTKATAAILRQLRKKVLQIQ